MSKFNKIQTLGCKVDALNLEQAGQLILSWLAEIEDQKESLPECKFVVTPNLDHAVLLRKRSDLREAYANAALVLADGMPLIWSARVSQTPLPERVAGSDLTPWVLNHARPGTKVYFLGASEASSIKAVENVRRLYPQIDIVGRSSPPFGFDKSSQQSLDVVANIKESKASLVVLGLGAPKQELWVNSYREELNGTVVLCVGATIDFFSGHVQRAPKWMQSIGVEWVHRLVSDPKRLLMRYGRDAVYLPLLMAEDVLSRARRVGG